MRERIQRTSIQVSERSEDNCLHSIQYSVIQITRLLRSLNEISDNLITHNKGRPLEGLGLRARLLARVAWKSRYEPRDWRIQELLIWTLQRENLTWFRYLIADCTSGQQNPRVSKKSKWHHEIGGGRRAIENTREILVLGGHGHSKDKVDVWNRYE